MDNVNIAEQLKCDPNLEAEYLDNAIVNGGLCDIHFANSEEFFNNDSKFYAEIIPSEYASEIYNQFFDIFNSQMSFFYKTSIYIAHTETGLLRMDIECDSCIIAFEIDTNANCGIVKHREAHKGAKVVSTWEEYPHKEIFLLGKAVFDDYFWGNGC